MHWSTLETTQGLTDGFFGQPHFKRYLPEVASVGENLEICPCVAYRLVTFSYSPHFRTASTWRTAGTNLEIWNRSSTKWFQCQAKSEIRCTMSGYSIGPDGVEVRWILQKNYFNLKLWCNEVYYTAWSLLVMLKHSWNRLPCIKVFEFKPFFYKTVVHKVFPCHHLSAWTTRTSAQ